jgi:hypothetical protein
MRHERQHISKGPLFCIRIETHDNHVFAVFVHRSPHKGNQATDKELGLINHNSSRRRKVRHLEN